MASNKKVVVLGLFALALFLVAHCAEAVHICTMRNKFFHGPCMSNRNCAALCIQKGIGHGGYCSYWRQTCRCTLHCWRKTTLAGIEPTQGKDEPAPLDMPRTEVSN
ncbi:unnamed protein product [Miscanthus lutarioriparius]|uniref:Knottins-like domain-containing protein n=1 Tax=Miscanthus lutarioriparius TaxID=422564 RepID=A0A811NQ67_9POAL|nr:unnamed protein product [Miscanthus lutarioriparius]